MRFVLLVATSALAGCSLVTSLDALEGSSVDSPPMIDAAIDVARSPDVADAGSTVTTLACGILEPDSIAVNASQLYVAGYGDGNVWTCPSTGCANAVPELLVSGQAAPTSVALTSTNAYWVNTGTGAIMRCGLGSCVSAEQLTAAPSAQNLAVTPTSNDVFWTVSAAASGFGQVWRTNKTNPTKSVLIADHQQNPFAIALSADDGTLAWSELSPGSIEIATIQIADAGPGATESASQMQPRALTLFGANVYWVTAIDGGSVLSCPTSGCGPNGPVVIAAAQASPAGLAVDATGVYWFDAHDVVVSHCPLSGCGNAAPDVVATTSSPPRAIALDDAFVYFTAATGASGCAYRTPK